MAVAGERVSTICRRLQPFWSAFVVGFIRKTLMVSSLGLVRGSSKKQRVAKAQLRELQSQTKMMRDATAPTPARGLLGGLTFAEEKARNDRMWAEAQRTAAAPAVPSTGPAALPAGQEDAAALWRMLQSSVLTQQQYDEAMHRLYGA